MSEQRSVSRRHFLALAAVAGGAAAHAQTAPGASAGPITLLFSMTVKPDRAQEFAEGARLANRAVELGASDAIALSISAMRGSVPAGFAPDRESRQSPRA